MLRTSLHQTPKEAATILVVAHPDDEILWFSSILTKVDAIIICFGNPKNDPDMSARRLTAIGQITLPNIIYLNLTEAGQPKEIDWDNSSRENLLFHNQETKTQFLLNDRILLDQLSPLLNKASNIYTHNPWGEYGHHEHIQVHSVIKTLQRNFHYTVHFNNYVSARTRQLASTISKTQEFDTCYNLKTNRSLYKKISAIYKRNQVWTWYQEYALPLHDTYFSANDTKNRYTTMHKQKLKMICVKSDCLKQFLLLRRYIVV